MLQTLLLQSVCGFLCKPRCAAFHCLPIGFCSFFFSFFNDKETLYYWGKNRKNNWGETPPPTHTNARVQPPPRYLTYVSGQFPFRLSHVPVFYTHASIQGGKFYILWKRVCFVNWDPKRARRSLPVCLPPLPCPWQLKRAICPGACPRSSRCPSAQPVV